MNEIEEYEEAMPFKIERKLRNTEAFDTDDFVYVMKLKTSEKEQILERYSVGQRLRAMMSRR